MVLGVGSYAHSKGADIWKECHHACCCPRVENSASHLVWLQAPRSRTIARWRHCAYHLDAELRAVWAAPILFSFRAERILEGLLPRAEVESNSQVERDCKEIRRQIVQNIGNAILDFAALQPKARVDFCKCPRQ